jgi:hypothetical protein
METNEEHLSVIKSTEVKKYGGVSAAILSRIRWWCQYNGENKIKDRFHDNEWWSGFMSSKDFAEQTGYNRRTIESNLSNLIKNQVIIKGCFNKKGFDRTGWYRINHLLDSSKSIYEKNVIHLRKSSKSIYVNNVEELPESSNAIPVNHSLKLSENLSENQSVNPENTSIEIKFEKKSKLSAIIKEKYPIQNVMKYVEQRNFKYIENVGRKSISTEDMEIMEEYNNIII